MRIKFFLRAAGADRLVSATELINLTGIDQFSGFSWIGNLLKNVEPLDARADGSTPRIARGCRACIVTGSSVSRNTSAGACAGWSAITGGWKC